MRVFCLLLTLGLLPACTSDSGTPSGNAAIVEVASAESLVADLDRLDADTVVLNFWATWCGPCRQEFPEFIRYDAEMADQGVHVRFVSLDNPTDRAMIERFLAEMEVDDPTYLFTGSGDLATQLSPFLTSSALPTTMILDGDGIVRDVHVGMMTYDQLADAVASVRAAS